LGLIVSLLLAFVLSVAPGSLQAGDWAATWALCQDLVTAPQERRTEAAERLSEVLSASASGVRAQVVAHHLKSYRGQAPEPVDCAQLPGLSLGGAWAFSMALVPGESLDDALKLALLEGLQVPLSAEAEAQLLQRGYERFMTHSEGADALRSSTLAYALHELAQAPWSAMNLAISSTRAGAYETGAEALKALLRTELRSADRVTLSSRLSLVYLGEGGLLGARRHLGAGLTKASGDSRIVLGLWSLERGRLARSRALFRAALAADSKQAWAGRGWGLSMVPRANSPTH